LRCSHEPQASDEDETRSGGIIAHWLVIKRQTGSHRILKREGHGDVVFAFHDGDEIGPRMLARIARKTGLEPDDL
jgi:predicted RNA binding protein YcfA (HicA-like mRNA interferase family)